MRKVVLSSYVIVVGLFMSARLAAANMGSSIAILGDSISTGAAAHGDLVFDDERLLNIFVGKQPLQVREEDQELMARAGLENTKVMNPPHRLPVSKREFETPLAWVAKNALFGFSHLYLDMEEYSWGYLLGKHLGLRADEILIAAEDGAKMQAAIRQVDRVLDHSRGALPGKVFFFYTGNDLCGPTMAFVTEKDEYGKGLTKAIDYLIKNGAPPPGGTDIYVLDPIGVLQLTQSPAILNKMVYVHGREVTCSEFQSAAMKASETKSDLSQFDMEVAYFMQFFPKSPAAFCPTVVGISPDGEGKENQIVLANRIRSYREIIGEVIKSYQADDEGKNTFRFHQITSTGQLAFRGEEIAQDCFHLSLQGQIRVAKAVLDEMRK